MRKLLIATLVAAAVLVAMPVTAALASPGGNGGSHGHKWAYGKSAYRLTGKVVSVTAADRTMVVKVTKIWVRTKRGFKIDRALAGSDQTITVAADARILVADGDDRTAATLETIAPDSTVRVWGMARPDKKAEPYPVTFSARKIVVWLPVPATPAP